MDSSDRCLQGEAPAPDMMRVICHIHRRHLLVHLTFGMHVMNRSGRQYPKQFEINKIKYLLGEIGLHILNLVEQGCSRPEEIKGFTSYSNSCISIKLELLSTIGLIREDMGGYTLTPNGSAVLARIYGLH